MTKFLIQGNKPLNGKVTVSGSKNAALPILAATILISGKVTLENVPDIQDVRTILELLKFLGAQASFQKNTVIIDTTNVREKILPKESVGKMRASILLLGPLLARFGQARMSYPGGCLLGKRSINSHIQAFCELGAKAKIKHDFLSLSARKLTGKRIVLPELSVTATENVLMAAIGSTGITEICLAAIEPHVQDLANFLVTCGAQISGIGTHTLIVKRSQDKKKIFSPILSLNQNGVNNICYRITGDYLEAGTLALAAVVTRGTVEIDGFSSNQLDIFWQKLTEVGIKFTLIKNGIKIFPTKEFKATNIQTGVFPAFPTDLQAPFSVLLTQCTGLSKIFETLFEGRLGYLFELEKMGARIEISNPHQAIILGPTKLHGALVASQDLRAGATLVLAALVAEGKTEVANVSYIDRGYEKLDQKLQQLGASIRRIKE